MIEKEDVCLYLTYKGLKQSTGNVIGYTVGGLYLTYKGLKLPFPIAAPIVQPVYILLIKD